MIKIIFFKEKKFKPTLTNKMDNLDKFVSKCEFKTKPMYVTIKDNNNNEIGKFSTPEGFQLEMYVKSLYPDNIIIIYSSIKNTIISHDVIVDVIDREGKLIRKYTGVFIH